jgi:hypothetical protein
VHKGVKVLVLLGKGDFVKGFLRGWADWKIHVKDELH